jgi:hypothetical protein
MCSEAVIIIFSARICTDVARGRDTPPQQQQQRDALRHRPLNEITHICLCIGQIERHLLMACVSIEKLSVHKNVFAHSVYCANALLFVNYDIREPTHTYKFMYSASESGYWAAWEPRGAKCCH